MRESKRPFEQLIGARVGETVVENVQVEVREGGEADPTLIVTLYLAPPPQGAGRWPASDLWALQRAVREIINAQQSDQDAAVASDIRFEVFDPGPEDRDPARRPPPARPHLLISPAERPVDREHPDGDPGDAA